ncbi:hypothetical protein [Gottschalkia acidurici]|nr:hypothetical protein [Gottschalkia acidurici]
MIVKSNEEFKNTVLKVLSFDKTEYDNYTLFTNKKDLTLDT